MPTEPPEPIVALLLITLGRLARERAEDRLRPAGITLRHMSALGHLLRHPGMSYSELARRAAITVQSMQATLRQLEVLGAIEGSTGPGRGRAARLQITDHGRDLLRQAEDALRAVTDDLLGGISPDKRQELSRTLLTAAHQLSA